MAKKKNETKTLREEMKGLMKEKEFVLHGIDIASSTEYFNDLNRIILQHVLDYSKSANVSEEKKKEFADNMREHFEEIRKLRLLYDNLKGSEDDGRDI